MSRMKTVDESKLELIDALSLINRDLDAIDDEHYFNLVWQNIANHLSKVLLPYKDKNGKIIKLPLIERVINTPTFHPLLISIKSGCYMLHSSFKMEMSPQRVTFKTFDEDSLPIELVPWLGQIFLVTEGIEFTIEDIIKYPRNKEAAHSDPKNFIELEQIKSAMLLSFKGRSYQYRSYQYHSIALAVIGRYAVNRINWLINQPNLILG